MSNRLDKILNLEFCSDDCTNQAARFPIFGVTSGSCYMVFDNIAIEYSQIDRGQAALPYRRLQALAKLGIRFQKLARWFFKLPRWFYKLPMLFVKLVSGFCASVINCKPLPSSESGL